MRVHFISIGGSIMHNLAIALKKKGYQVSGSDDEVYEPAKSRLQKHGLLPESVGWNKEVITKDIDFIVLGMHAKEDNPELKEAVRLKLKIVSFPEFIYEQSKDKKRVVIAGSHGKTTITSMLMHVLNKAGYKYDYLVGSKIDGFEDSVKLSNDAEYMIIEGDEYLTSSLDPRPKFLWYKPHISLITGIAWDHMNVFPTFDIYKKQFGLFLETLAPGSKVVYFNDDEHLPEVINQCQHIDTIAYTHPDYQIEENQFILKYEGKQYKMSIYGSHNMLNINGVSEIGELMGISKTKTFGYLQDFKGAGKRLELLKETKDYIVFRDFAHAPSKLKATISGIKEQYADKKLLAFFELHTFSSLNRAFLPEYNGSFEDADEKVIYINPHAVKLKGLEMLTKDEILSNFGDQEIKVFFEKEEIIKYLNESEKKDSIILLMSSGNFDNINFTEIL
jgi:UDP-N-acetylmuramate: L-alanyl-gamma-D-glutamyl-meso-diaminopimelate ligase